MIPTARLASGHIKQLDGEFNLATTTATAGGTSYGSTTYRNYALIVLTLVYTLNFIDRSLLNVIGQPIIAEFHLSDMQ